MAFLDEVEELKGKVPPRHLPRAVIVGVTAIAVCIALACAASCTASSGAAFEIENASGGEAAELAGEAGEGERASDAGEGNVQEEPARIYVYVVGAVRNPGVYELAPESRANDAVMAAGGFTEDADTASVNLARLVTDGEQIVVPVEGQSGGVLAAGGDGSAAGGGPLSSGITAEGKVNLNTATCEQLQTLSGIGEALASRIIASREQEGPFQTIEDLKRVSGIGDKKFAAIADSVAV